MKRVATNLMLVMVALGLAFGLAEILVRLLMADTTVLFPRYHTDYRYGEYHLRGIRPNEKFMHSSIDGQWEFVTNSAGFRNDRDFAYDKPPDVLRILVLGDSHTQGYEVRQEATYAEVLRRSLSSETRKVEVLNAGVSGFGTAEELAFLENEGYRYHPDVVVLGFFGNDYEDNLKAGLFALDPDGRLIPKKYEHIPGVKIQNVIYAIPGVKWLGEHSHFYSLLFNTAWVYYKYFLPGPDGEAPRALPEYAVPTKQHQSEGEIALAASLIERMQQFCNLRHIRLIVVDIPTDLDRYRIESSLPLALRDRLKASRVEIVSSESLFQPYANAVDIHLPHGYHHISEFSHALIGVELGRRIGDTGKAGPGDR